MDRNKLSLPAVKKQQILLGQIKEYPEDHSDIKVIFGRRTRNDAETEQ